MYEGKNPVDVGFFFCVLFMGHSMSIMEDRGNVRRFYRFSRENIKFRYVKIFVYRGGVMRYNGHGCYKH